MSEFRPHCPKCKSQAVSVHRDRSSGWVALAKEGTLVLKCRTCGKELFDKEVTAELDKQRIFWESKAILEDKKQQEQIAADVVRLSRVTEAQKLRDNAKEALQEAQHLCGRLPALAAQLREIRETYKPTGQDFSCAANQVTIGANTIRRLAQEMERSSPVQTQSKIQEVRRLMSDLPKRTQRALELAKLEAAARPSEIVEPTPVRVFVKGKPVKAKAPALVVSASVTPVSKPKRNKPILPPLKPKVAAKKKKSPPKKASVKPPTPLVDVVVAPAVEVLPPPPKKTTTKKAVPKKVEPKKAAKKKVAPKKKPAHKAPLVTKHTPLLPQMRPTISATSQEQLLALIAPKPDQCAWLNCQKKPRKGSNYCSKTCGTHCSRFAYEVRSGRRKNYLNAALTPTE